MGIMMSNVVEPSNNDALMEKKLQLLVDQQIRKLRIEVDSLSTMVVSLQSELANVKQNVSNMRFQQQAPITQVHVVSEESPKPEVQRSAPPGRPDPVDFQPGEITIEKYFSFGKKK